MQLTTCLQAEHDLLGRCVQLHPERIRRNRGPELPGNGTLLLLGGMRALHLQRTMLERHAKLRFQHTHLRVQETHGRQPSEKSRIRWVASQLDAISHCGL